MKSFFKHKYRTFAGSINLVFVFSWESLDFNQLFVYKKLFQDVILGFVKLSCALFTSFDVL